MPYGTTPTDVTPGLQWFRASLLVLLALCMYLHVPLRFVPSFPTILLTPLLLLLVWPNLSKADVVFLPKIAFVLLLSVALSPGYEFVGQKLLGLVQCAMALMVTVLIVRLMQQIRRDLLERALLVLWCLIVMGSVLEIVGVIRGISDAFRAWAYGGLFTIYDADLRDASLVGWPRPKLFSVEPSHVTKIFIASINAWLLVRITWGKVAVVAVATLAMLTIMGSPMLLISAAVTGAILLWNGRARFGAKVAMILSAVLIAALFATFYEGSLYSNVASRVANVGESSSNRRASSEQRRMIYPYITTADVWQHSPLFGLGISGKEMIPRYTSLPVTRPEDALGNNVMAEFGTYLGLMGGAWFIYLLLMQVRHSGVQRLGLMGVFVILFSQLMGGFETFRYWGFIALLWGALAVADEDIRRDAHRSTA